MNSEEKIYIKIKNASHKGEKDFPGMDKVWNRVEEKLDNTIVVQKKNTWQKLAIAATVLLSFSIIYQFVSNDETIKGKVIHNNTKPVIVSNDSGKKIMDKAKEIVVPVKDNPSKAVAIAPVSSTVMELTSESKLVSDNFKANKGRLPWPVDKGTVFLGFGTQAHPVYKTLTIQNSGLSIATYNGAHARAVFAGEVFSVIAISNNKAVMIQHGDYFTVYQNLSTINVSKGDKVSTKQSLGTIRTNSDGKTILKFTLCQNVHYVNPKPWLSPK